MFAEAWLLGGVLCRARASGFVWVGSGGVVAGVRVVKRERKGVMCVMWVLRPNWSCHPGQLGCGDPDLKWDIWFPQAR